MANGEADEDRSDSRADRSSVQVIERAADILRLIAHADGLSLADIAKGTNLPRSTIQRIVKALRDQDFVTSGPRNADLALGDGLRRLVAPTSLDIAALLDPLLQELAAKVDETVDLSTLQAGRAMFVAHIAGTQRLSALSAVGTAFPLHSTANGKAMLALLAPARMRSMLEQPLIADTDRTITDVERLIVELEEVQASGVAFDLEEHTRGVCAVGAAFFDRAGGLYALSVPVPLIRFEAKREALTAEILAYRERMARAVAGYFR